MSDHQAADERLRAAFQALDDSSSGCSREDLDRIWRAVAGELPVEERLALVDRMAVEAGLAEAWRIAHALHAAEPTVTARPPDAVRRASPWLRSWLAAAAMVLLGVASAVVFQRFQPGGDETFRTSEHQVIRSLVAADARLPRNAFRLRWSPGPPEARYQVRVTTDDLRLLTTTTDLVQAEFLVPPEILAEVPSGATVLWQVEAMLPSGARLASATFTARVE